MTPLRAWAIRRKSDGRWWSWLTNRSSDQCTMDCLLRERPQNSGPEYEPVELRVTIREVRRGR